MAPLTKGDDGNKEDAQQHRREIERAVSAPVGKLRATINAGREHPLAEFCFACVISTVVASDRARALCIRASGTKVCNCFELHWLQRSVGESIDFNLLAHPPQRFARTSNSSPPFFNSSRPSQQQPLHCTARASNAKSRVALRPTTTQAPQSPGGLYWPPSLPTYQSTASFPEALAPLPQRV